MKPQPAPTSAPQQESGIKQFCNVLRDEAKKLSSLAARLHKKSDDPRAASPILADSAALLKSLGSLSQSAVQLAQECDRNAELGFLQVQAAIEDICAKRQWRLDGQWPDFVVEYGVPVHIDEAKKAIVVGSGAQITAGELEKKLAAATTDLMPKKFSAQEFMEQLQIAYDSVTHAGSSQAPIFDVYRAVVIQQQSGRFWRDAGRALFSPMSIDQFRARFSRMLEAGVGTCKDGRELRLFPPLNPKDAVFLFQPSERRFGFVGRIEFVKP